MAPRAPRPTARTASLRAAAPIVVALAVGVASCAGVGSCGARDAAPAAEAGTAGGVGADRPEVRGDEAARPTVDARARGADAAAERAGGITVAVVSDLNGAYGSTDYAPRVSTAVSRILALAPDLAICTGDMVAGQQAGHDYRAMWAAFHRIVTDRLAEAGIPLAVTPGNHDGSGYARYAEERAVFVSEWARRRPEVTMVDDGGYPLHYAFSVGPALFVALDATTVGPLGQEQMDWLDAVLRAHGSRHPVTIVFGHLPLHPLTEGREREVIGDLALEQLLVRRGVDLYLSGHHHAYYPARRGPLRLVAVGPLGGGPRRLLGEEEPAEPSFVLLRMASTGVLSVEAYGGAGLNIPIERTSLPASIGEGEHRLIREDLAPSPPTGPGARLPPRRRVPRGAP